MQTGIDPCLNNEVLYQRLEAWAQLGDFMMTVGSTSATASPYVEVETVYSNDEGDD